MALCLLSFLLNCCVHHSKQHFIRNTEGVVWHSFYLPFFNLLLYAYGGAFPHPLPGLPGIHCTISRGCSFRGGLFSFLFGLLFCRRFRGFLRAFRFRGISCRLFLFRAVLRLICGCGGVSVLFLPVLPVFAGAAGSAIPEAAFLFASS